MKTCPSCSALCLTYEMKDHVEEYSVEHTASSFDASCGFTETKLEVTVGSIVDFFVTFFPFVVMSFADRLGERKKAYKSTVDTNNTRRRREDEAIQIGKREKDEQVARRRRLIEQSSDFNDDSSCGAGPNLFNTGM